MEQEVKGGGSSGSGMLHVVLALGRGLTEQAEQTVAMRNKLVTGCGQIMLILVLDYSTIVEK